MCVECNSISLLESYVRHQPAVLLSHALLQACLSWWNVVSPFGGFGSTAALAFVLIVAAIKAIFEDKKRHQEDHRTNKSIAHIVQADGTLGTS